MPLETEKAHQTLTLFGCSPDTGNLGVSALCYSIAHGLSQRDLGGGLAIADYGRGVRSVALHLPSRPVQTACFGVSPTKRFYRPESMIRIGASLRFGIPSSASADILRRTQAILDISGGDSFTDLYGPKRFAAVCFPKQLALTLKKPLILLPQTYGPFKEARSHQIAAKLARNAAQAWARDARSFGILRELLGDAFDPARHRLGVDVAFALPTAIPEPVSTEGTHGLVGINVSGLIWNNPEGSRTRYGFVADYRAAIRTIVERLSQTTPVTLIPHVLTPPGHYESDRTACEELLESLPSGVRENVRVCADPTDPCKAKGMIAQCTWFLGTRMHATIAGLSSGVPTAAISYSDKTLGVFESCGQGEHVHDPRRLSTDELIERVLWSFGNRAMARASLAQTLPGVLMQATAQMNDIVNAVQCFTTGQELEPIS